MVFVGQLHRSFGVVGQMKLSFDFSVLNLQNCSCFFYQDESLEYKSLAIQKLEPFQKSWLVQFTHFKSLESVQFLNTKKLFLSEDKAMEYFDYQKQYDLIDFEVIDQIGLALGVVDRVQPSPAQDLLVVIGLDKMEKLIPNVKPFILDIDEQNRKVKVDFSILEDLYNEN